MCKSPSPSLVLLPPIHVRPSPQNQPSYNLTVVRAIEGEAPVSPSPNADGDVPESRLEGGQNEEKHTDNDKLEVLHSPAP